jgi:DNA polymerase-3 subunit epsilon
VSAEKWNFDGFKFTKLGTFERFYWYPTFPNFGAMKVHHLTPLAIMKLRCGKKWPMFWYKDVLPFIRFIGNDTDLIVGHNSTFDRKFYSFMNNRKIFCTMWSNVKKVGSLNKNGKLKQPKLIDTARSYGIVIEEEKLHYSAYDVELTAKVFMKMLEEAYVPTF